MKFTALAALAALACTAGCSSTTEENHWRLTSIPPRVGYHFVGYEPQEDGSYMNRLRDDTGDLWLSLERHFWLGNPNNPRKLHSTPKPPKPQPPDVEFKVKNK